MERHFHEPANKYYSVLYTETNSKEKFSTYKCAFFIVHRKTIFSQFLTQCGHWPRCLNKYRCMQRMLQWCRNFSIKYKMIKKIAWPDIYVFTVSVKYTQIYMCANIFIINWYFIPTPYIYLIWYWPKLRVFPLYDWVVFGCLEIMRKHVILRGSKTTGMCLHCTVHGFITFILFS